MASNVQCNFKFIGAKTMFFVVKVLQISVALGLLNVWLLRFNKSTSYRGGKATSMKQEFATYGLPGWVCYLVGTLKVAAAIVLIVGLWFPVLAFPSAALVAILMVGALAMHFKISDPLPKSLPAAAVLVASLVICAGTYGGVVANMR